jgi:hypothetical protein
MCGGAHISGARGARETLRSGGAGTARASPSRTSTRWCSNGAVLLTLFEILVDECIATTAKAHTTEAAAPAPAAVAEDSCA